jgi:hypothetical protein
MTNALKAEIIAIQASTAAIRRVVAETKAEVAAW